MKVNKKYIGCNYNIAVFGGIISSYNGKFTNEEVLIGAGLEYVPCILGDVSDAEKVLDKMILERKPTSLEEMMEIVFTVVNDYFGGIQNVQNRMNNYKDLDEIKSEDDIVRVTSLKGKGEAACVERAMLTQNLLKRLNIDSYYKCAAILINNNHDIHSFNVIQYENKYYIVDTSLPTLVNDNISPLICEIPDYVYLSLIRPEAKPKDIETYSVEVSHYNPLRSKDITVKYDRLRNNNYEVVNTRVL